MKVVTAEQMAAIDSCAIEQIGIPAATLMEGAGKKIARVAIRYIRYRHEIESIAVFALHGNNGGDAFVAAQYLLAKLPEIDTHVYFISTTDKLKSDARLQYERLEQTFPGSITQINSREELLGIKNACLSAGLIIDGLFGTGFHGTPEGLVAETITFINRLRRPVLSVDVPSGLNATTGEVNGLAVKANMTVTFGLPKKGLLFNDGPFYSGKMFVENIGFPDEVLNLVESDIECIMQSEVHRSLVPRPLDAHKMTFGHLMIIAGSEGLTGAAIMASQAAYRAGCGMVTLGCAKSLNPIFETALTETITLPLPETDKKTISVNALEQILDTITNRSCGAILIGPGLGRHPDTDALVQELIVRSTVPLIVDADALNALAETDVGILKNASVPVIVTPHPGEMGRLQDCSASEIQWDRLRYVAEFAQKYGTVTLLKGHHTLVASPDAPTFINTTGNAGLATAGSGDVLAGIIGSFLVQGMSVVEAACAAVFYHGKAADYAVSSVGKRGMIATDLIRYLSEVIR